MSHITLDALPADIISEIFTRATTITLLNCAFVSRRMCEFARHELRKRTFFLSPGLFKSNQNMANFVGMFQHIARKIVVDFGCKPDHRDFGHKVFLIINACTACDDLTLKDIPQRLMEDPTIDCDFSRIRNLNISCWVMYHTPNVLLKAMLQSCKPDVLRDLQLHRCIQTGEDLKHIPGQLDRLIITDFDAFKFRWAHVYAYLARCPQLTDLRIVQPFCKDTLSVGALCANLQYCTLLQLQSGGKTRWREPMNLINLRHLDVQVSGQTRTANLLNHLAQCGQLERIHLDVRNFRFTHLNTMPLRQLAHLNSLEVCAGDRTRCLVSLVRTLRWVPSLRVFALYPNKNNTGRTLYELEVPIGEIVTNLRQVEQLRIELPPVELSRLFELPALRALQLRICIPHPVHHVKGALWRRIQAEMDNFVQFVMGARTLKYLWLQMTGYSATVDKDAGLFSARTLRVDEEEDWEIWD